jgi:hypothetical protein
MNRLRIFVTLVALVAVAGGGRPASHVSAASRLENLRGVDELKSVFNHDVGKVRLVLLLSPT